MVPSFDMQGGAGLVAARGVFVASLLSAFGTLVFRVVVAPRAFARMPAENAAAIKQRLLAVAQVSIATAAIALLAWLVLQAANMAEATSLSETFTALPTVLSRTSFGCLVMLQLAALLIAAGFVGTRDKAWRLRAALGAATIAVSLQAGHSHAASMYRGPSILLLCNVIHVLGAGAWLGGLLPLLLLVRDAPAKAGACAARWFSPLGKICIAALVVSAAFQAWVLLASVAGVVGTAYGWMALVKAALFCVLLGFAAANRYRFAPALRGTAPEAAKRILVRSIWLQTGAALAIICAAAVLSELPPAMHVQALWPFPYRLSLAAVREDADFRREVIQAALALAGAASLLITACLARRWRIPASLIAAVIAWCAVPHFDLLLAQAYPTSFYHSPTGFTTETITLGRQIYAQNCVSCHGAEGRGDGPAAASLPVPPADLTAPHLWMHSDGELFWWLTHGIDTPEGLPAMPGFAASLDEDQRWAVIDYIRAHNAGVALRATGRWSPPVHAPAFTARCAAGNVTLAALRGQFVRLAIGNVAALRPSPEAVTLRATSADSATPQGVCIVRDQNVPASYGIVSDTPPDALDGTQFLIDGQGWLRAIQPPGATAGWDDPAALATEIQMLRAHPLAPANNDDHMHMPMQGDARP